MYNVKTFI